MGVAAQKVNQNLPNSGLKYFSQPGVAKDILLYGVLVLLTQLTFFLAIQCSNAGTAAILAATIPVFTTIPEFGRIW